MNLGVAEQDNGVCRAVLDIRYPVTADGEEIFERLRAAAGAYGVKARVLAEQKPLFVPEDTPLIRMLKGAYETVTGGRARLYGTGRRDLRPFSPKPGRGLWPCVPRGGEPSPRRG